MNATDQLQQNGAEQNKPYKKHQYLMIPFNVNLKQADSHRMQSSGYTTGEKEEMKIRCLKRQALNC